MNRCLVSSCLVTVSAWSGLALGDPEHMSDLETDTVTTSGTTQEIVTRARSCVAQIVKFDPIAIADAGGGALFGNGTGGAVVPGGDVITLYDAEQGLLVANSRTEAKFLGVKQLVQSTVTIQTKEGRFRIRHSNILSAQRDTGYSSNTGFEPVYAKSLAVKNFTAALKALSSKLADCISKPTASDW